MHKKSLVIHPGRLRITLVLLASAVVLSACADFFKRETPKPKPITVSKSEQAEAFVLNLAMAQLALLKNPDSLAEAKPYVTKLNQLSAENKATTHFGLMAVALEYKASNRPEIQKLLVPVSMENEPTKFQSLTRFQKKYSGIRLVLHNIHAYYLTVSIPVAFKFVTDNPKLLGEQLDAWQKGLFANAEPMAPLENAQLQVQLTRFFLEHRQRDAAYLALENAKDTLAVIAESTPQTDITLLSQETDILESRLHREMPYNL